MPRNTLGILAGGGALPRRIIQTCRDDGRDYFIVAFDGHTDPETVVDSPHVWVRLGAGGKAVKAFKEAGVGDLVMAGRIERPSIASLRPDIWTARLLARSGAGALGDDGFLTSLINELEHSEGFHVVGVEDLLPGELASAGVYGSVEPDDVALSDLARAAIVARAIGALDVGQAAVVQQGLVLAVESIEGTDAMVDRAGALRRDGVGGVLVKVSKPEQEMRADLPAIGVMTVMRAHQAGLRGIGIEAGGALVIDREAVIDAANDAGLFIVGLVVDE